jgi:hypothetical protein
MNQTIAGSKYHTLDTPTRKRPTAPKILPELNSARSSMQGGFPVDCSSEKRELTVEKRIVNHKKRAKLENMQMMTTFEDFEKTVTSSQPYLSGFKQKAEACFKRALYDHERDLKRRKELAGIEERDF